MNRLTKRTDNDGIILNQSMSEAINRLACYEDMYERTTHCHECTFKQDENNGDMTCRRSGQYVYVNKNGFCSYGNTLKDTIQNI